MKKIILILNLIWFSLPSLAQAKPSKAQCFVKGQRGSHLVVISEIKNNKAKVEYSSSADADMNFGTLDPDNNYTARVRENINEIVEVVDNKPTKKIIVKNEIELYNDSISEKKPTSAHMNKVNTDNEFIDGVEIKQRIGYLQASINKVSYRGTAKFKLQNANKIFDMVCEPYRENVF